MKNLESRSKEAIESREDLSQVVLEIKNLIELGGDADPSVRGSRAQELFNEFCELSGPFMDQYLQSITGKGSAYKQDIQLAEDAKQEVFLELERDFSKKFKSIKDPSAVIAWLKTSIKFKYIRLLEKQKSRYMQEGESYQVDIDTVGNPRSPDIDIEKSVLDELISQENADDLSKNKIKLQNIIEKLNEKDRALAKLMLTNTSGEEIAKELGIGYETYKTRRRRLLQKIKELLT